MSTLTRPNPSLVAQLQQLLESVKKAESTEQKLYLLQDTSAYKIFFIGNEWFEKYYKVLNEEEKIAVAALLALGQGTRLFERVKDEWDIAKWNSLVAYLCETEKFYRSLGGVLGYYNTFMQLFLEKDLLTSKAKNLSDTSCWQVPTTYDLIKDKTLEKSAVQWGIENLRSVAEIYVLGGAAERLNFLDDKGQTLPAAFFIFEGRSLLEGLLRDVQAREFLYFQLEGQQFTTAIAMMTSSQENDQAIQKFCESKHWFGRNKEKFISFCQPMAPVINEEGNFVTSEPLRLLAKPGGHGVLWKLAKQKGIFDWFKREGGKKVVVRQVNNPLGAIDSGLLSFIGIGQHFNKLFGFITCPRVENAAEGVIALKENYDGEKYLYCHSNIEYTFWQKKEHKPSALKQELPANVNILFADIAGIEKALHITGIPGLLINMKGEHEEVGDDGMHYVVKGGRLESTMQNISDEIFTESQEPLTSQEQLKMNSFIMKNYRHKTISVTKKAFTSMEASFETPQRAFYDILFARAELLKQCGISVATVSDISTFFNKGPNFLFSYHPGLGPLFSIISQKIKGGRFANGSELQLEIANLYIEGLDLAGSMIIKAQQPLAKENGSNLLSYSNEGGRCILRNVSVRNLSYKNDGHRNFWKGDIEREETVQVILHGSSEFIAENVCFEGDMKVEVEDGFKVTAKMDGDNLTFKKEPISLPSWYWHYSYSKESLKPVELAFVKNDK